jgi:hypothetical protein
MGKCWVEEGPRGRGCPPRFPRSERDGRGLGRIRIDHTDFPLRREHRSRVSSVPLSGVGLTRPAKLHMEVPEEEREEEPPAFCVAVEAPTKVGKSKRCVRARIAQCPYVEASHIRLSSDWHVQKKNLSGASWVCMHLLPQTTNLGPTIRCTVAFGAQRLIVVGSRKFSRHGAQGSDKHVRVDVQPSWAALVEVYRARGFAVVGVSAGGDSIPVQHRPFGGKTVLITSVQV